MNKLIITIYWLLIGVFFLVASMFFIPCVRNIFKGSEIFLIPLIVFSLLGVILLVLTLKSKVKGKLKKFLLLASGSAIGFFVFIILHNIFYALEMVGQNILVLKYFFAILHIIFFLTAIFICPVCFLIGAIGSMVLLRKGFWRR